MQDFLKIIVGFVLTGLIGNYLLHAWQARTWLHQQRFLGQEKEYIALKELADEIATLLGVRVFYMKRLNRVLANGSNELIDARIIEHDDALKRWNERLTSFYIRLPMLTNEELGIRLEKSIQNRLVKAGARIDELVKVRKKGAKIPTGAPTQIENELNEIQGRVIAFNQRLLAVVRLRRVDIYFGERLRFSPGNLSYFSTWQLIKALFVRDIDSFSVVRASLDS